MLYCVAALLLLWQRGLAAQLSRLASRCSLRVSLVLEEPSTHEVAQMPVDYVLHGYYVFLLLKLLDVLGWDAGRSPNTVCEIIVRAPASSHLIVDLPRFRIEYVT